jgi:hypothetical protein
MKLKEMLEILKESHPDVSSNLLIKMLNRASDDFCRRTEILESTFTANTIADQRYYELDPSIVKIIDIDIENESADELAGRPHERDIS